MSRIKREVPHTNLPIIGKIAVGELSDKGYPRSVDYFIARGAYKEDLEKMFLEKYGTTTPNKFSMFFHSENIDEVCIEQYELRDASGKMVAYGDGITFYVNVKDEKTGLVRTVEEKPTDVEKFKEKLAIKNSTEKSMAKWEEILILRFMIIGFNKIGTWEYRTKGKKTSLPSIVGTFDTVLNMAGRISSIPFELYVHKHVSNTAGNATQYPVVNLICDLSDTSLMALANHQTDLIKGLLTDERIRQLTEDPSRYELEQGNSVLYIEEPK